MTFLTYSAHDIIYSQGDEADAIFYLQRSKANATILSKGGKEAVLAILGSGDFFGEGCATAHQSFHEQVRRLGFIDYNGELKVHRSLLNIVLRD